MVGTVKLNNGRRAQEKEAHELKVLKEQVEKQSKVMLIGRYQKPRYFKHITGKHCRL